MDQDLEQMIRFVDASPAVYRPGPFWTALGGEHTALIESAGFDSFKRTINIRYFDWRPLGILRHQFGAVARAWAAHPSADVFRARFSQPTPHNPLAGWIYRTYVAMYADLLRRQDPLDLLGSIEEPAIGRPFTVRHRGRDVSQDLCNSIHEFYAINGAGPDRAAPLDFCEIGAGYGRVAHVTLTALPRATYTIVDIPPSLYLSQRYLSQLFGADQVFKFRPFTRFDEVRDEFMAARIRFVASPQLPLLPPKLFDRFVNISSLHEMTKEQVTNYLQQMDRVCRGRVYTKQFRTHRAKAGDSLRREEAAFRADDYPIPPGWRVIYHRQHEIQRLFFEALYEVPPA